MFNFIKEHALSRKMSPNSLFFKYFKIVFCIIFIPVILLTVFTMYYTISKSILSQKTYANNLLNLISLSLENNLSNYSTIHQHIISDNVLTEYFINNSDITLLEKKSLNHITDMVSKYIYIGYNNLDSVLIYSLKNGYVISNKYSGYIESFYDSAWYKHYQNPQTNCNIVYATYESNSFDSIDVLSVLYPVYNKGTAVGIVVFNLNINDFMHNFNLSADTNLTISDSEGHTIFNLIENCSPKGRIAVSAVIKGANVSIGLTQPIHNKPNYWITAIMSVGICLLLSLALSYYVSSVLYKIISKIVANTYTITTGEIPSSDVYDEIVTINQNLLSLTKQTDKIKYELSENQAELRHIQSYAMQMQINPHFLFNTLNSMYILSNKPEYENTGLSKMILLLSDLMDASLNYSQTVIPLHKELVYTKKYVDIVKIREKNSFEFLWNVPANLSACKIVKLSIQPLIENAVEHGLKKIEDNRKKIIQLKIHKQNNIIYVEVHDNGNEIPQQKLEQINERINNLSSFQRKSIGLKNINQRIKLTFGNEYGCYLTSDSSGTTSIITLPADS